MLVCFKLYQFKMASEAAKLLDELMGRNRNAALSEERRDIRWEDQEVCKYHLCDFCPHDLFTNTRADLGTCDKLHDDDLKQAYQKSSRFGGMGYEEEYLRFLQDLLADVERRIKKGQSRLHLNNAQTSMAAGPQAQREEKIEMLSQRINDLVEQAEELGCEGNVEQAQGVLKLCEKLKEERNQLENSTVTMLSAPKEMEVCDVCGAFLVVNDAKQRVDEHLMGKQHMGYAKLRTTVDDLKKKLRGETDAERAERLEKERAERHREREERQQKEQELQKEREKEREERRKKRKQEEEEARSSRKKRSRSRSRSSRSRGGDRGHKSDRRSRSRDRHSCQSSRDRHRSKHSRRSRSREHKSSRHDRRSRDRDRRSRDKKSSRDRSSKDQERSSKDKERSSKDRDKSRSSKDRSSRDGERSSKDSKRSSKDQEGSSKERKPSEEESSKVEEGQIEENGISTGVEDQAVREQRMETEEASGQCEDTPQVAVPPVDEDVGAAVEEMGPGERNGPPQEESSPPSVEEGEEEA